MSARLHPMARSPIGSSQSSGRSASVIEPTGEQLAPEPERHADQRADQHGDDEAQRQQIDHPGVVLGEWNGKLVTQGDSDPENPQKSAEHAEDPEVVGRVEAGQQGRSGEDEELTERRAGDRDNDGAPEPALRQERPQDPHHEGRDRRGAALSLVVGNQRKQAGAVAKSRCYDAHAYFSVGCHETRTMVQIGPPNSRNSEVRGCRPLLAERTHRPVSAARAGSDPAVGPIDRVPWLAPVLVGALALAVRLPQSGPRSLISTSSITSLPPSPGWPRDS